MQQVCARASNVLEAQRRDAAAGHRWGRQRRAPPADEDDEGLPYDGVSARVGYRAFINIKFVYYPLALTTRDFVGLLRA